MTDRSSLGAAAAADNGICVSDGRVRVEQSLRVPTQLITNYAVCRVHLHCFFHCATLSVSVTLLFKIQALLHSSREPLTRR